MKAPNRGKRGFTLIETIVTVGIVAALAAVVYPQVVKQFDSADPTRLAEDLNNIRTGIEVFGINVRPHQPMDIEDLANVIQATFAGDDSTALGASYATTDPANWNGPYIGISVPDTVNDVSVVITTGYGATIPNNLELYQSTAANGGASVATASANTADFLAVQVLGLSGAAYNAVNELLDGPTETTAEQRRHFGRLRCPGALPTNTAACAAAFYLAAPLRQ